MNTFIVLGIVFFVISHFVIFLAGFAKGLSANIEDVKKLMKEIKDSENSN